MGDNKCPYGSLGNDWALSLGNCEELPNFLSRPLLQTQFQTSVLTYMSSQFQHRLYTQSLHSVAIKTEPSQRDGHSQNSYSLVIIATDNQNSREVKAFISAVWVMMAK